MKKNNFKRDRLPSVSDFISIIGLRSHKKMNARGYYIVYCPFHNQGREQNPSLNINSYSGHFKCHACGQHGKDIIDFYMQLTGKSFRDSAKYLGAWEEKNGK